MEDEEGEKEYGVHFGRADIERVGFFDDPSPGPFGRYVGPIGRATVRTGEAKAPQMLCRQHGGLFERQFQRMFIGEALPELGLGPKKKKKKKQEKVLVLSDIIPPGGSKLHSTPGDWYGCIGRRPTHFSPETKQQPEKPRMPPNFSTRPNPAGGPGYLNICLNRYLPMYKGREPYDPEFQSEPTDSRRIFMTMCRPHKYFDENPYRQILVPRPAKKKSPASKPPHQEKFYLYFPRAPLGPTNGCFSEYPEYMSDPYIKKQKRFKPKVKGIYRPVGGPDLRSKYTVSIIELVTRVSCNAQNFTEYREQVYKLD